MDNLRPPCVVGKARAINLTAFEPGGPCIWPAADRWNPSVRPLRAAVFQNAAPSFMGGIHPRFKNEVGRRLALAYRGTTAPTIAGCTATATAAAGKLGGAALTLRIETGRGDRLGPPLWAAGEYDMTAWAVQDSSALMVCVGPDIPLKPRSLGLAACQANASHWVCTYLMVPCDWALVPSHLPAVCMALTCFALRCFRWQSH